MSFYQELILDHYKYPRNKGKLKNPTNSVVVHNPLCGDKIEMGIKIAGNKVIDVKFEGDGCAISQASASILTEYIKGKNKKELIKLDKNFIIKLLGVEVGPNRLKCALLALEAVKKCLK